jgi:hypothetical protein
MKLDTYLATMRGDHVGLLARLEARLGWSLAMPAVGRPYVARLGERVTAPDMLRHASLAHALAQTGLGPHSRVLEIGGGFGMFALCARRAGIGHVTIIDLPFVNAIQMGYLGAALSPAEVSGVGEAEAAIALLPPVVPQHRVAELVAEAGGWRRISRHRAWMEQGYVEEVYARV